MQKFIDDTTLSEIMTCNMLLNGTTLLLLSNPKRQNVFGFSSTTLDITTKYQAVIRPLLEYTSVAGHSILSKEQTHSLEKVAQ